MVNTKPIIETINSFQEAGRRVVFFYPENIMDDQKRQAVLKLDNGTVVQFPIRGNLSVVKKQLVEVFTCIKNKEQPGGKR